MEISSEVSDSCEIVGIVSDEESLKMKIKIPSKPECSR